jgi:UDP-N-acetylmuramyl pentapeptide phosphotransferase/UDP-N-acetylglucosamine-1-phosphate transferase
VHWVPLVASLIAAAAIAPTTVRALAAQGMVRENYRGTAVAFPAGIAIVSSALVALVPLSLLEELADVNVFRAGTSQAITYVIGVALLGLLDDLVGTGTGMPRGWRGHVRAAAGGGLSTGGLKAVGSLGLALYVMAGRGLDAGDYLLAVAVLVLATNVFNLLDMRPGRSAKALVLLGAGLTLGSWDVGPLWTLGLFVGPILVLLPLDLRELGMLGDTGSNAIGAVAGLWLVLTLSTLGLGIAAALLALITVYGEFRSISTLVDRTPGLRQLDLLGRSHA